MSTEALRDRVERLETECGELRRAELDLRVIVFQLATQCERMAEVVENLQSRLK